MSTFLVTVDSTKLQGKVHSLLSGLLNAQPLMRQWGDIAHASVQINFDIGGRPKWKSLSPVTIKKKGHDRILIGRTGNLQNITVQPGQTEVRLGTHPAARAYASIHQNGGMAGRNLSVLIPARPYMLLQRQDEVEIQQVTKRYLIRLSS